MHTSELTKVHPTRGIIWAGVIWLIYKNADNIRCYMHPIGIEVGGDSLLADKKYSQKRPSNQL